MFEDIRKKFPVYEKNPDLIFLDTAASALKPYDMIDAITNCYSYEYANVHRGLYSLSSKLTKKFEDVRVKVSNFISSKSYENIIFTKSATEGINLVVEKFSEKYLSEGDEVIISYLEHHANIVPWHMAAQKYKFKVIPIELTNNSEIDYADFKNKITSRTKFISLTHISNVTGSLTDFDIVKGIIKNLNIPLMIDGCQFVAHSELNVTDLDCDFYVFSGHKLYGPSGIGVLYMKERWFDDLDPYQGGGSMIDNVDIQQTTYAKGFQKFEAGTPPIAQVIGFSAAIDFLKSLDMKKVFTYECELHDYTLEQLKSINDFKIYGNSKNKGSLISFNIESLHHNDVALLLNQKNIAIRSGHHCAQPLVEKLGVPATTRVSFYVYNDKSDIDKFVHGLEKVRSVLS